MGFAEQLHCENPSQTIKAHCQYLCCRLLVTNKSMLMQKYSGLVTVDLLPFYVKMEIAVAYARRNICTKSEVYVTFCS